jgi:hypothetical protein
MPIRETRAEKIRSTKGPQPENSARAPVPAKEREAPDELLFTATKQITIRCGESSITLTAAGKIILRGKYIVSRSSGVQRIKGGSVQIN